MLPLLFLYLLFCISMSATTLTHPVSLILTIILQATAIAALTGLTQQTFWFGYILILIFLGGMLIIFSYITSLASNFMFSFSSIYPAIFMMAALLLPLATFDPPAPSPLIQNIKQLYFQNIALTMMMVTYLLMILLIVVNITNINMGPLRYQP